MINPHDVARLIESAAQEVASLTTGGIPPADRAAFLARFADINSRASDSLQHRLAGLDSSLAWLDLEGDPSNSAKLPEGSWWVCDAIDGAVQLIQGLDSWSITLALVVNGATQQAWVHDPIRAETFHAALGEGATVNGHAIRASGKSDLRDAVVATSHAPGQNDDASSNSRAGAAYAAALSDAAAVRNLGPTSLQLAWVAAGRLDAFWAFGADQSNWLSGVLIAAEAGASISDAEGSPVDAASASILVTAPELQSHMLALLSRPWPEPRIEGVTAREFIEGMAQDCFPPHHIGAQEATDKWTNIDGYRQVTNGEEVSREQQVKHLAFLQAKISTMDFKLAHVVFDGSTIAVLQEVTASFDGQAPVRSEVAAFFTVRAGRITQITELTRAVESHFSSQQIHTAH